MKRDPVPVVVQQHEQEAIALRNTRSFLVRAPHVKLNQLRRLDDRLAAHLDGLDVAGEYGSKLAADALESPGPGEIFTATVRAIEERNAVGLEKTLALAQALPDSQAGLVSAFGWVSTSSLRGITKALLEAPDAFRRQIGLAACAAHGVDPAASVAAALKDADAALRARALRVVAALGRVDLLADCVDATADADAHCAFEAARAGALLGDRRGTVSALRSMALVSGPRRPHALALALKLLDPAEVHAVLKSVSQNPAAVRLLIRGIGVSGDPHYVPWLIQQMNSPKLARIAGESFSLITGVDVARQNFERTLAESPEAGPSDDPDDDDIAMDEDHGLPWPDSEKITAWWQASGHRFVAGTRYFMGEPPSLAHCLAVLKEGYQRQRIAAAEWRCVLQPGMPLFNTAAPAWRQQRWLGITATAVEA
ncbi:MAG: TIGR02270 family protein [Proteobacteria bacterium]|nr:TIGR02270 family protein [Pseudomonadota bacterium]